MGSLTWSITLHYIQLVCFCNFYLNIIFCLSDSRLSMACSSSRMGCSKCKVKLYYCPHQCFIPCIIYLMSYHYPSSIFLGTLNSFVLVNVPFPVSSLGMKDSWGPLKALAVSSVVNGVGDVVLCSFLGYGIAGAAWATMVSQVC